jgi:hypothetical protein
MAAAKITLVLGSHAHVPYGADTAEFEKVYTGLVRPFITGLNKFPHIQAALHYSGVLLHWVERSHPEMFMLIEDMVNRRQVEMLGGGFYEPMLPIIPAQDKIGQIELLTTYLRRQFGKRPQGCWIPAFAWEQGLVSPLAACGMSYTFLGDRQFTPGGGYPLPCICEDQGKVITVFPVMQSLEAELAEKNISSLLPPLLKNVNKRQGEVSDFVVSIFPSAINAEWCHFFEDLSQCEEYAETIVPGKLVKNLKNLRKGYFSDSPATADGISSRRFIIEYPEAGGIYAKMVFTNVLINQLRGDKSRKLSAHEELWKAQGSALFCKAGHGGLHNHALRNAAYSALLAAERITREKTKFIPSLVPYDFNMDGVQEWLFQDIKINCYVQSTGGGIFELDYLPKAWNYLDTCGGRVAFADRLLPPDVKAEDLVPGAVEGARLCRSERYEVVELDKVRRKLHLKSEVSLGAVEIEKIYMLKKDTVHTGYVLTNSGAEKAAFQFAPEIDIALPGEGDAFARFFACNTSQADAPLSQPLFRDVDGLKIHDIKNEVQITLSANRPFAGKIAPVYVRDESADAQLYQSLCVMPALSVSLEPGEKWEVEFSLRFTH